MPLVNETLDVIFDEIIPERFLVERLVDAMAVKKYQRPHGGRPMEHRILLHASNHLSTKLEELDIRRDKFLDLLTMFVNEDWRNA